MLVADTSALVMLAVADSLDLVLAEFDVHTTATVVDELRETADYEDENAAGAAAVLDERERLGVHEVDEPLHISARVDEGEASCAALADSLDADFLLTDDLRALLELQALVDAQVAISPIVLRALVIRGELTLVTAPARVDDIAETRDWLGTPLYRRARGLFEEG
ncbi:MAG: hypothetical protein ABEJ42_09985 [Halobacteriaceae archaeon]